MITTLTAYSLRPGSADYTAFVDALTTERLPTDDLAEPGRVFLQVEQDGQTVGFGGYELHGEDALLRSVVIPPALRGVGLGRDVAEGVLRHAAQAGARRAYLLTTSAAPFFERLGFSRIERAAAPESIRSTRQAASLCPSSAAFMMRPLNP
jgi:N-acetylglutamate synthase-like GNAT family acetyltransferase